MVQYMVGVVETVLCWLVVTFGPQAPPRKYSPAVQCELDRQAGLVRTLYLECNPSKRGW
jgi:hypothetical protein